VGFALPALVLVDRHVCSLTPFVVAVLDYTDACGVDAKKGADEAR